MRYITILLLIILLLFNMSKFVETATASDQHKPKGWGAEQGEDIPLLDQEQEEQLDIAQAQASSKLLTAAQWLDSFFEDGRSTAETNTTSATLKLALGYSKNDEFEIKPQFNLLLRLPQLSSRAHLFVEAADAEKEFNVGSDPITNRPTHTDSNYDQLTAGLRFFLRESKVDNVSLDTGASWDYLFAGLRYRFVQDLGKWHGRLTNRLRYYTDDGFENIASYDLEKQFNEKWLFRTTSTINLYEGESGVPHSQYFRFFQVLGPLQAISYEMGAYFDTDPSYKMTDTQCIVKYRQRFFRDWLVLEISPRISFPEDHDREANPGIIFNLEAAIGYKSDEEGYKKIFR